VSIPVAYIAAANMTDQSNPVDMKTVDTKTVDTKTSESTIPEDGTFRP
jgi:hypothetical protein